MGVMTITEYISKDSLIKATEETPFTMSMCLSVEECNGMNRARKLLAETYKGLPAADVVPWEFLERYADYFCAVVSMPEFIREAKAFYEDMHSVMDGGTIGEAD